MTAEKTLATGFLARLDAVEGRLTALATMPTPAALTEPDPKTQDRWEAMQVWGHVAEFVPFWLGQARKIISAGGTEPVPFGRTPGDTSRRDGIERYRDDSPSAPLANLRADLADLRRFLAGLEPQAWQARGEYAGRGVMRLDEIVGAFLIGHLEEHVEQLDRLARAD